MEQLIEKYKRKLKHLPKVEARYLFGFIDWNEKLISIKGARGVGKTTLMLQHILLSRPQDKQTLYVSLDDLYFQANTLSDLVEEFYLVGGKYLYLDEVHKYQNWSIEIKNIYDNYPNLFVVFTSSSLLEIQKGDADLSRRAVTYELRGLSFREYLRVENILSIEPISLQNILSDHENIAEGITSQTTIISCFRKYLEYGYYPFYNEGTSAYFGKLNAVINLILETDIPSTYETEYKTINKIKRLLYVISTALPYIPNITKLSGILETTSRNSTLLYLDYLEKAHLTNQLKTRAKGNHYLVKPDKIYLENTNLMYLFDSNVNRGTLRETFFINQMRLNHQVHTSKKSDFLVDQQYTFEIGGRNKNYKQIKGLDNAFIAADDVEIGFQNKIPLWMFGLMY